MRKTLVLDTNLFLFDAQILDTFENCDLLIPLEVIEEIDKFKHDPGETGRNARRFAQIIDQLRTNGSLQKGIEISRNCTLRIVAESTRNRAGGSISAAEAILRLALYLQERCEEEPPVIISKNVNLRVKADALGLTATDYDSTAFADTAPFAGWQRLPLASEEIQVLKSGMPLNFKSRDLAPNEYVFAQEQNQPKNAVCARMDFEGKELWPIPDTTRTICGLRSLNIEQTFTMDALLDESISLVTLSGKAGTGKTLLAIAAGLQQIFGDNRYQKLIVFRPTLPVSRDLGFLPGDLSEKMRPWMQPVYDALEFIRLQDRKNPARILPNDLMSCREISIEPLTYIRGRSIPNQFIIIDEAQNLTPLEIKTVVTRVGHGSKMILTGDPEQIDTPYLDAKSNGLSCLIQRFRESPLSAHITLTKGERSELAETAAALL